MSSEPESVSVSEPEPVSEPDDLSLPVNIHFPDQRVFAVDIDSIMGRGLRMRRNRKALTGAVAAVAIGVLGVSAAYLVPTSSSGAPVAVSGTQSPNAFQQSSAVRDHPPAGGRATVIGSRANPMAGFTLSAVAWLSGGQICYGAADLSSTTNSSITCANRPSTLSPGQAAVLAPHVVAGVTDDMGSPLLIGFASGDVAKVSLKIRGHLYDATVVPLTGSPSIGAYMLWPSPANGVITTQQDFAQITGYNTQGTVVAGAP